MAFDTSQVRDLILEIEERFPVESWTVGGLHVWPLLRIRLAQQLYYIDRVPMDSPGRKRRVPSSLEYIVNIAGAFRTDARARSADRSKNADANGTADALFLSYSIHRVPLDGLWYDKFCEPYVEALAELGRRSLLLEMSPDRKYRLPRNCPSLFVQPVIDRAMIRDRLAEPFGRALREALPDFEGFVRHAAGLVDGESSLDLRAARRLARLVFALADWCEGLLRRTKPSVVFLAEYYNLLGSALILACRRRGIQTVDIQHGLTGDEHMAYGSFRRMPAGGYEVLPSVFWCWSRYEASTIERWNRDVSDVHEPFVGGNLWNNMWTLGETDLVRRYDREVAETLGAGTRRAVLFSVSTHEDLTNQPWLIEAIRRGGETEHWWVRAHPGRPGDREVLRRIASDAGLVNVEVDQASDLPLPALLRRADVVVACHSSTVYEAEEFGVPSILVDPTGVTLFPSQLASGWAVTAFGCEEARSALELQARKRSEIRRSGKGMPKSSNVDVVRALLERCGRSKEAG